MRETPAFPIPELPAQIPPPAAAPEQVSRSVTAYTGQYIEVPFRGTGWVYLGEQGSRRGVYYDSRRIDSEGMVFVFRAGSEGVYTLKFNRQDFIRDTQLDDYVQITVKPAPEITGSAWNGAAVAPERVVANPRWPPAVPQSASPPANVTSPPVIPSGVTPPSTVPAVPPAVETTGSAAPATLEASGSLPSEYLAKAKEAYDAGRPPDALDILDQYRAAYPGGSDEAYWLYGQALEANSPSRDIRRALDYYRRLVNEYPQSARYDAARQRIAYLERFFFNIR
jgi:hypothetical protein